MNPQDGWRPRDPCHPCLPSKTRRKASLAVRTLGLSPPPDMREGMPTQRGRVEVIAGPMFAGNTEELLRRVRRAVIAGQRV